MRPADKNPGRWGGRPLTGGCAVGGVGTGQRLPLQAGPFVRRRGAAWGRVLSEWRGEQGWVGSCEWLDDGAPRPSGSLLVASYPLHRALTVSDGAPLGALAVAGIRGTRLRTWLYGPGYVPPGGERARALQGDWDSGAPILRGLGALGRARCCRVFHVLGLAGATPPGPQCPCAGWRAVRWWAAGRGRGLGGPRAVCAWGSLRWGGAVCAWGLTFREG